MSNKKITLTKFQLLYLQKKYKTDRVIAIHLLEQDELFDKNKIRSKIQSIYKLRKKYGIPVINIKKLNKDRNELIYSAYKNYEKNKTNLAKNHNLSVKTIYRIIKSFNK